jgi:hypothetical protein
MPGTHKQRRKGNTWGRKNTLKRSSRRIQPSTMKHPMQDQAGQNRAHVGLMTK